VNEQQQKYSPEEELALRQLSNWIRTLRKMLGISQETMAERMNISQPRYSEIEKCSHCPTYLTLLALAAALGIPSFMLMYQFPVPVGPQQ